MNVWYVLDIGDIKNDPVAQRMTSVMDEFKKTFMTTPAGSGMALFFRENSSTRRTELFFTPQAKSVAIQLGAIECRKPVIGNGHIKALIGDQELDVCFPWQEQQ